MSAYSNAGRRGGGSGRGSGRGGFGGKRTGVRYGDGQVVQVVGPGMFYPERKRIPFWLVVLWRLVQAAAVVTALEDEGLSDLSVPWPALVTFVVVSGILGVLAALFPALRASRLNVLQAITTQ